MAWTSPKTDFGTEVLTSAQANAIGANLEYLFSPNSAYWMMDEGSDYSTTSTTFVDVDTTAGKGKLTIDTDGGNVLLIVSLSAYASSSNNVKIDVEVDNVSISNGSSGLFADSNTIENTVTFVCVIEGLSDGSHTFDLKFAASATTATIIAGTTYQSFWGVARMG